MPPSKTAPPVLPPFALSLPGTQDAIRPALARVLRRLKPLGLGAEERETVELVLAEVLNNIVEHGYPDPAAPGPIDVCGRQGGDGLWLRIEDQGRAMPGGQLPRGLAQAVDVATAELPEGGFGWALIRDLAKDISYRRRGGVNQLDLRLAVGLVR